MKYFNRISLSQGLLLLFAPILLILNGCASVPKKVSNEIIGESTTPSYDKRPDWTIKEPEEKDGKLYFVGLSGRHAMEKDAWEDAHNTATNYVVKYIGNDVKIKISNLITSYGLSKEIINPLIISNRVEEQEAEAYARKIKAKERYIEQQQIVYRNGNKKAYYSVFELVSVPKGEIERIINEQLEEQRKIAESAKSNNPLVEQVFNIFGKKSNNNARMKLWQDKPEGIGYKENENIIFRFKSDFNCYVYIFHMDVAGDVRMLFPNYWEKDNKIVQNQENMIPNEKMNFNVKVVPPFGSEVAIAVAVREPISGLKCDFTEDNTFKYLGKIGSKEIDNFGETINKIKDKYINYCVIITYKE
ncbi:MAG: DUF4384 domain-containing protein [Elusimicrobiota bacterium]